MDVELADVAEIRTGYSFRGKVTDDPAGRLAVVQMKDIRDTGQLELAGCFRIQEEPAHRRHLLQPSDVLIQARGTTFPAARLDAPFHGIASFGLHVLHPCDRLLPEYLVWALNHPVLQATITGMSKGSSVPFLSKSSLAELQIPLPSLEIQRRFIDVARLERDVASLTNDLQRLHDQYASAATWRAATHP